MGIPVYNGDIIGVRRDWRTKKIVIPTTDQNSLLRIVAELSEVIDTEFGAKSQGPLRFIIPLAMRFTEQAGPVSFRRPRGNNPYNVMGSGVERPDNHEEVGGKMVPRGAHFQAYPNEKVAIQHFFKLLKGAHDGGWERAYIAIRDATSFEAYASGLRPKGKPHYLTRNQKAHTHHLKGRARESIKLLKIIYGAKIAKLKSDSADDEVLIGALGSDPLFGPDIKERLKRSRLDLGNARKVFDRLELSRKHFGL